MPRLSFTLGRQEISIGRNLFHLFWYRTTVVLDVSHGFPRYVTIRGSAHRAVEESSNVGCRCMIRWLVAISAQLSASFDDFWAMKA